MRQLLHKDAIIGKTITDLIWRDDCEQLAIVCGDEFFMVTKPDIYNNRGWAGLGKMTIDVPLYNEVTEDVGANDFLVALGLQTQEASNAYMAKVEQIKKQIEERDVRTFLGEVK